MWSWKEVSVPIRVAELLLKGVVLGVVRFMAWETFGVLLWAKDRFKRKTPHP